MQYIIALEFYVKLNPTTLGSFFVDLCLIGPQIPTRHCYRKTRHKPKEIYPPAYGTAAPKSDLRDGGW